MESESGHGEATADQGRRIPIALRVTVCTLAMAAAGAWLLPQDKPHAVLGRLSWWQFMLALSLSLAFVLSGVIVLTSPVRRRKVGLRITVAALATVLSLIVSEAFCLYWPARSLPGNPWLTLTSDQTDTRTQKLVFERSPHIEWKGMSHGCLAVECGVSDPYAEEVVFRTDHEGFRNGRDLAEADIVFIGDSHTEAGYLTEKYTFPTRIGHELDVVVRNLGRINHCPSEELVILQEFGLPCRPNTVVWQICEHNDMADECLYSDWLRSGMPDVLPPATVRSEVWKSRSPTWQLFRLLRSRERWPWQGEFTDGNGRKHPMLFVGPLTMAHRPRDTRGFPLLATALHKGILLAEEHDFQLVLVLIPEKLRVMGHFVDFDETAARRLGPNWDLPDDQTLGHYLGILCEKWRVPFVDMTEPLKALAGRGDMVYLPYETHLSASGHRAVSEELLKVLQPLYEHGLRP